MRIKEYIRILGGIVLIMCITYLFTLPCQAWPRGERREEKHWLIVNFIPRQYTYMEILKDRELFNIYYEGLSTSAEKRKARWDFEAVHGR